MGHTVVLRDLTGTANCQTVIYTMCGQLAAEDTDEWRSLTRDDRDAADSIYPPGGVYP